MFRRFGRARALLAVGGVVAALALAGGAYAYFTATNSTSGSAGVGSATPWTVQDTSNPNATTLYPGQGSFDITGTITNGGSGNQGLSTLVVQVNAPTGGGGYSNEAACSAADFVLSATSASGWAITNGGDTATYTFSPVNDVQPAGVVGYPPGLSLAMVDNTTAAQDNCQGATANWSDTAS